ncbi:MAG: hypothetical protein M3Q81_03480 [bacterium]|nr:hypothetical protein [bacterium]
MIETLGRAASAMFAYTVFSTFFEYMFQWQDEALGNDALIIFLLYGSLGLLAFAVAIWPKRSRPFKALEILIRGYVYLGAYAYFRLLVMNLMKWKESTTADANNWLWAAGFLVLAVALLYTLASLPYDWFKRNNETPAESEPSVTPPAQEASPLPWVDAEEL